MNTWYDLYKSLDLKSTDEIYEELKDTPEKDIIEMTNKLIQRVYCGWWCMNEN